MGQGGRKNNGRTAREMIIGCLASRKTAAPPLETLGFATAQDAKGAVDLCPREWRKRERHPKTREDERGGRGGRGGRG